MSSFKEDYYEMIKKQFPDKYTKRGDTDTKRLLDFGYRCWLAAIKSENLALLKSL